MKLAEIVQILNLKVAAGEAKLDTEVSGGYVSDLLSNVMSQAQSGSMWITLQGHPNIIAVAALAGLAAVVVAGDAPLEPNAIQKAQSQNVVLLTTPLPVFELAGRLYPLVAAAK